MKNTRISKGYGIVSNTVMRDPDISLGEKSLYAYLSTYADANNQLFVSVNKMADECGVGQSTVKRYLSNLEKKQIISRISRGHKVTKVTILLK
jgi:DNA-binding MarR family transcriptional regulator